MPSAPNKETLPGYSEFAMQPKGKTPETTASIFSKSDMFFAREALRENLIFEKAGELNEMSTG